MSEIRATTISDAAGTGPITLTKQSAAKAWVNFNGTGTIAARDSFNFSSLTDNATGDYTITRTNAMANADYMSNGMVRNTTGSFQVIAAAFLGVYSATQARYNTYSQTNGSSAVADSSDVFVAIHGDLA